MNKRKRLIVAAVAAFFCLVGMLCVCVPLNIPDEWGTPTDVYWYVREQGGFNVDDRNDGDWRHCEDKGADFAVERPLLTAIAVVGAVLVPTLTIAAIVVDASAVGTMALSVCVVVVAKLTEQARGFSLLFLCYTKMASNSPGEYGIYNRASVSVVVGASFLIAALVVLAVLLIRPNSTPRTRVHMAAIAASVVGLIVSTGGGAAVWDQQPEAFANALAPVLSGMLAVLACVLHDQTSLSVAVAVGVVDVFIQQTIATINLNPNAYEHEDHRHRDIEQTAADKADIIFHGYAAQTAGVCVTLLTMFAVVLRRLRASAAQQQQQSGGRLSKVLAIAMCVCALVGGACVIGGIARWKTDGDSRMGSRQWNILAGIVAIPPVLRFFGVAAMLTSLFVLTMHVYLHVPDATALMTKMVAAMVAVSVSGAHFFRATAEGKFRDEWVEGSYNRWAQSGAFQEWSHGGIEIVTAGLALIIISGLCALPFFLKRSHNSYHPQTTAHKLALALSTASCVCAFVALMVGLTGREDRKEQHIAQMVLSVMTVMASLSHTHYVLHVAVGSSVAHQLAVAVMFAAQYQSVYNNIPDDAYDYIKQIVAAHSMSAVAMILAVASSAVMASHRRDDEADRAPGGGTSMNQVEGSGGGTSSYAAFV